MAALRNLVIGVPCRAGPVNVAAALRRHAHDLYRPSRPWESASDEPDITTQRRSPGSRCEMQNSLAMLEVCWDGHVVVHNQPDTVDSPEARCPTHPQVSDLSASQRAVQVVDRMNEGQLAVGRDVQVAYLVGDSAMGSEGLAILDVYCQPRRIAGS
jgi:hypothetical protein